MANKKQTAVKETTKKQPVKNNSAKKVEAKKVDTKKVETKKVDTKKTATKKTEVKKVAKVEEPMANIMEDESIKESKKVNSETLKFIGSAIFWIVFAVLAFIWITDFVKVTREEEPVFCLKNTVHEFEDGTVTECTGLGYKVYTYNRDSFDKGVQFGPFFIKMKEKSN